MPRGRRRGFFFCHGRPQHPNYGRLPVMFQALNETLEAYQRRDPAARSKLEIFLL